MDQRMLSDCDCGPFYLLTRTCRLSGGRGKRRCVAWVRATKECLRSPFVPSGKRAWVLFRAIGHVAWMEETKIFTRGINLLEDF
jgi:hypothetical protein